MTDQEMKQRIRTAVEHAAPDDLDLILSFCGEQLPARDAGAETSRGSGSPFVAFRIILDVNPSIYLEVDGEGKVLKAEALSEAAAKLFDETDLKGADLESAMDTIVKYMLREGYLSEDQNSILVSVEDAAAASKEEVREKVSDIALEAMAEQMGVSGEGVSVISQAVDEDDDELAEIAGEYGISMGKAELIRKVAEASNGPGNSSGALDIADLAPLSINEIALLAQERGLSDASVTQVGHASGKAFIGQHRALEAALKYAGVKPSRIKKAKVKLDAKYGLMIYKVKIKTKKGKHHHKKDKFKYYLDARTGKMVRCKKYKKHYDKHKYSGQIYYKNKDYTQKYSTQYYGGYAMTNENTPNTNIPGGAAQQPAQTQGTAQQPVQIPEGAIGEAAAKAAALAHAGVTENQAKYVYCNPQIGHGPDHYDVKFVVGGMKYKYAIGLYDGAVLGRAVKNKAAKGKYVYEGNYHEHYAPMGEGMTAAPVQPATPAHPLSAAERADEQAELYNTIGEDKAFAIALSHAGLTQSDLIRSKVKLVSKHGSMIYRFKLKIPGYEHEIDVDAYTGAVTKSHKEIDY